MKILLTTLNARYTYTCLALWYLKAYVRPLVPDLEIREFNINQNLAVILNEIYDVRADLVGFSVNIWNGEQTMALCRRLKKIAPEVRIVLGGPEVSHDALDVMEKNPAVDCIVAGEGEQTFYFLLENLLAGKGGLDSITGLVYRENGRVFANPPRPVMEDLGIIPRPYQYDLSKVRDKMIYYETSRGCPYRCGFCLSALEPGVRYFPLDRVKKDLLEFTKCGVAQVKLVDRSFNCHPERAVEIWDFLMTHAGRTNFHFEISGDYFTEGMFRTLKKAPPGLFQFEIGVQSTHQPSLACINRRMDFNRLAENFRKLKEMGNIHLHLDLIAGLPEEDWAALGRSFNDVYDLAPGRLQLGFLKLLKGSDLRERAALYGIEYADEAPYEVLCTKWLSYKELRRWKCVEEIIERIYNSHRADHTLDYLLAASGKEPFHLYLELGDWWKRRGYHLIAHKSGIVYVYLDEFIRTHYPACVKTAGEVLLYDYLLWEEGDPPAFLNGRMADKKKLLRTLADMAARGNNIPQLSGLSTRDLGRRVTAAIFSAPPPEASLRLRPGAGLIKQTGRYIFLFIRGKKGGKAEALDLTGYFSGPELQALL
ncbi:MAG: DUF4080 domain-containing protein [Bacillota bacterium]